MKIWRRFTRMSISLVLTVRQTYGDELMPFKSLYLALHLHIPSHVVPEIISFLDSALQFPLSIDNDQIKNMKVEYVSIYAKMIAKLTQIDDIRVS
jgi:hypothetical protein